MSDVTERLRAISRLQPPGTRTVDRHNRYDHESRAPDTRSTASDNRGSTHPWRAPIPTGKRAMRRAGR